MSNMSYCRFENTSSDLADCAAHIHDQLDDDDELQGRQHLLDTCKEILEAVGCEIDTSQSEEIFY